MTSYYLTPVLIAALATAAGELGVDTRLTLGGALSVGTVIVGGAWWIGRWMQRVDSRLSDVEQQLADMEKEERK